MNDMTYQQFSNKLEYARIEYMLLRFSSCTYVEVGRFGFGFGMKGNSAGGWIRNCADDWRSEWKDWFAFLNEPTACGSVIKRQESI